MSKEKNAFGGGNANSLYIPLSETEQEVISRLVDNNDMVVEIHNWGYIEKPVIVFGDKNLHIAFKMFFDKPEHPVDVHFFDMELKTRSGISLFRKKTFTEYGGKPLSIMQGVELEMVWDISIRHIDPKVIKLLLPSNTGLTSRLQDSLTGEFTITGNMRLDKDLTQKAYEIRKRELLLPQIEQKIRNDAKDNNK